MPREQGKDTYIDFFNQLAFHPHTAIRSGDMFHMGPSYTEDKFRDIDAKVGFFASDVVLDVGGGTGEITKFVSKHSAHVTLSDGAGEALSRAREQLSHQSNIEYVLYDIINNPYPFPQNHFDKIICYSVIQYLENYEQLASLLTHLVGSLKKGGILFVGDIPFMERKEAKLFLRSRNPIKHLFKNLEYSVRKFITENVYRVHNIRVPVVQKQITLTEHKIESILKAMPASVPIEIAFLEQNKHLAHAGFRIDLRITKKQNLSQSQ